MLCASPSPQCGSDPCGAAPPDPCPASVLECLAQLTSAVAVRLLYVAGNGDETLASGARCSCKLPVDIHSPRHQTGDQSQAPSSSNALAEHARLNRPRPLGEMEEYCFTKKILTYPESNGWL